MMTINIRVTVPDIQAKHDVTKNIVTISLLSYYDWQAQRVDIEVPCQIFEELIKNISTLAKRSEVKPEEISTESLKQVADKLGLTDYNKCLAHTIAAVLNTDIKIVKKKKYKILTKLSRTVDKETHYTIEAASHEDASTQAKEKIKHDWPSYKVVEMRTEECT